MRSRLFCLSLLSWVTANVAADTLGGAPDRVHSLCERVGAKLSSVDLQECAGAQLTDSGATSARGTALAYRDFIPEGEPEARVLLIGGIHGDEYSSVSIVFKWLSLLGEERRPGFHWRVVPVANPDGLLMPPAQSQRMNANGVDLNRNFPTPNWENEAWDYWVNVTQRSERRYPGPAPLSEPESAWLAAQIETFKPQAVVSVHAPHGIVDFDGPDSPPQRLGPLELQLLGTYPGSMGRYLGVHKGIPLLTVELESAERMPSPKDVAAIWRDMLSWLDARLSDAGRFAAKEAAAPGVLP